MQWIFEENGSDELKPHLALGVDDWLISKDNHFSQAKYFISNTAHGLMLNLISIPAQIYRK